MESSLRCKKLYTFLKNYLFEWKKKKICVTTKCWIIKVQNEANALKLCHLKIDCMEMVINISLYSPSNSHTFLGGASFILNRLTFSRFWQHLKHYNKLVYVGLVCVYKYRMHTCGCLNSIVLCELISDQRDGSKKYEKHKKTQRIDGKSQTEVFIKAKWRKKHTHTHTHLPTLRIKGRRSEWK